MSSCSLLQLTIAIRRSSIHSFLNKKMDKSTRSALSPKNKRKFFYPFDFPTLHCPDKQAPSSICRETVVTEPEITEVGARRQVEKSPLPSILPSTTAVSAFTFPVTSAFLPITTLPLELMFPLMDPSKIKSVEQLRSPSI